MGKMGKIDTSQIFVPELPCYIASIQQFLISLKDQVDTFVRNTVIETHIEKVFCVEATDLRVKQQIKNLFQQGNRDVPHTEVRIQVKDAVQIKLINSSIYIYGKYIKMSRDMTQTPLRIKGRLKTERSVSDFTVQLKEFFKADEVKFSASGREDIDVRMTEGRPFLVEIRNPKANINFERLPLDLYDDVVLKNLKVVDRSSRDYILNGETSSHKLYRLYLCSKQLMKFKDKYSVSQLTPIRVVHRRANLSKDKEICVLKVEQRYVDGWYYYMMDIRATAGTYIKEFVSGDLGRTSPSLRDEGWCGLLDLDVISVEMKEIEYIREIELQCTSEQVLD